MCKVNWVKKTEHVEYLTIQIDTLAEAIAVEKRRNEADKSQYLSQIEVLQKCLEEKEKAHSKQKDHQTELEQHVKQMELQQDELKQKHKMELEQLTKQVGSLREEFTTLERNLEEAKQRIEEYKKQALRYREERNQLIKKIQSFGSSTKSS